MDTLHGLDLSGVRITGDEYSRGREYNLARCEGLFLLIALYLDPVNVVPVLAGIHGSTPVVFVEVEGFEGRFEIYEYDHRFSLLKGYKGMIYKSSFNFERWVPTESDALGQNHTLLIEQNKYVPPKNLKGINLNTIDISGDRVRKGRDWNLRQCEGILKLISNVLGLDKVMPVSVGVTYASMDQETPCVMIRVEGLSPKFSFYIREVELLVGKDRVLKTMYVTNCKGLDMFVDLIVQPLEQRYLIVL